MPEVRYFAGAKAAAGVDSEICDEHTLTEIIRARTAERGPKLGRILGACSFLVDGTVARDLDRELPADATVDVLPPFAGG